MAETGKASRDEDPEYVDVLFGNELSEAEISDNWTLIAAAPDLLEACEDARIFLQPDLVEPGRTVFWKLVAAINKAKGLQ